MALVALVAFWGLLQLGEVFVDILDGDERPGEEVAVTDGRQPGGFGGNTDGALEVSDGAPDAWELVDIVNGLG